MSDLAGKLADTLEWCAERGRIEGLHPEAVREAASLLRSQSEQIEEMTKVLGSNTPTVFFKEYPGLTPYTKERVFTFVAAKPQSYHVRTEHCEHMPYPLDIEARRAVSMFARQFKETLLPLTAAAIRGGRINHD